MVKFTGPGRSTSRKGGSMGGGMLPGRPTKGGGMGGGLLPGRPTKGGSMGGGLSKGPPRRGPAGGGTMQPRVGKSPGRVTNPLVPGRRPPTGRVIGAMKKAPRAK